VTSPEATEGTGGSAGDQTSGWPSAPSSNYLAGSIDEVAIYPAALSGTQIAAHYAAAHS